MNYIVDPEYHEERRRTSLAALIAGLIASLKKCLRLWKRIDARPHSINTRKRMRKFDKIFSDAKPQLLVLVAELGPFDSKINYRDLAQELSTTQVLGIFNNVFGDAVESGLVRKGSHFRSPNNTRGQDIAAVFGAGANNDAQKENTIPVALSYMSNFYGMGPDYLYVTIQCFDASKNSGNSGGGAARAVTSGYGTVIKAHVNAEEVITSESKDKAVWNSTLFVPCIKSKENKYIVEFTVSSSNNLLEPVTRQNIKNLKFGNKIEGIGTTVFEAKENEQQQPKGDAIQIYAQDGSFRGTLYVVFRPSPIFTGSSTNQSNTVTTTYTVKGRYPNKESFESFEFPFIVKNVP